MVSFKLVDLARLQGQLNIAAVRKNDMPLYDVVSQLIGAVKQVQNTVNFNISTFSQGLFVSAGTSGVNVLSLVFSNQNSVSFGLNGSTITASANPGILFSASGSSGRFTGLTFSNSNSITFGNSNGVITASFSVATSAGNITISAGTSTVASNSFVFSNSGNVSFGLNGRTITGSAGIALSAGTAFGTVTDSLVFSNANGVSFGIAFNSVLTASVAGAGGNIESYFENLAAFQNIASVATNNASELFIQPFVLPFNLSASYLRHVISQSFQNNASFGGTSANTSFSAAHFFTHAIVLYTLNTGASSNSLKSIFSTSFGRTLGSSISNGTAGSQFTISYAVSYNAQGFTSSTFTASTNFSNASYLYTTGPLSNFQGAIFFDIPFATSLSMGNYFLGNGLSTTSSNNGPAGAFSAGSAGYSSLMASQLTVQPKIQGATTQTDQLQPGLGRFTTNAAFFSTSGFDLSVINSRPSNNVNLIQFINRS